MIYTQLIQTLYRQADRVHKGRLPVPVHCLMDEYANISLPKDTFLSALATMRSRAIFCSIIVQNMAQLKALPNLQMCLIGAPHQKQKQPVIGCTKQDFFTVHNV